MAIINLRTGEKIEVSEDTDEIAEILSSKVLCGMFIYLKKHNVLHEQPDVIISIKDILTIHKF